MDVLKQTFYTTLTLALLAPLVLGVSTAQAQNTPGKFYFGVGGGLVQSDFDQSAFQQGSAEFRQGINAGGHFLYHVNEALSVEFGVQYVVRGAESVVSIGDRNRLTQAWFIGFRDEVPGDEIEPEEVQPAEVKMEYIDIPILFSLTSPQVGPVKFRALAGPTLSARFSAFVDGNKINRRLQSNREHGSRFRFWDLQGVLGGEIALPVTQRGLDAEVALRGTYEYGFFDVDLQPSLESKNRTFGGRLMVRIGI